MKLPDTKTSVETLQSKLDAERVLATILERKQELEDYVAIVQPLLYTLSVKLYGDNSETISLDKIISDGIKHINGDVLTIEAKELK